jgi:CheY-like chemotaxis protein
VKRNLLVIDDDPDLRETLELVLADSDVTVTTVAGGQAALEMLAGGARPDLILLDLMMPEMNGWQFLERVRADAALASIPVIIMTAHPATNEPLSPPVREILRKPFTAATLLDAIGRHANRGRS